MIQCKQRRKHLRGFHSQIGHCILYKPIQVVFRSCIPFWKKTPLPSASDDYLGPQSRNVSDFNFELLGPLEWSSTHTIMEGVWKVSSRVTGSATRTMCSGSEQRNVVSVRIADNSWRSRREGSFSSSHSVNDLSQKHLPGNSKCLK